MIFFSLLQARATNRSPSRSPSPPARRSFSVSRSRSPYRGRRRFSRSITPPRRSRSRSLRRSISPQRRSVRSLSRSLSRHSRFSRSPFAGANGTARSVSGSPSRHRGAAKPKTRKLKKKSADKKGSKRRTKRRKPREGSASGVDSPQYDAKVGRSRSRSLDNNNRLRSWSRSVSPPVTRTVDPAGESWTPPIAQAGENLRITLANREKKRRREKKKKSDKHRSEQRKEKKRQRTNDASLMVASTSIRPSKEVFASGDNILVSVSFNKEKEKTTQQQTTIVTLPASKDQIQSKKQTERNKKSNKDPNRKRKKLNVKPVAIIDLDNSPFKEMTPSPRAVIILSDSENEREGNKENSNQQRNAAGTGNDPNKTNSQPIEEEERGVEVAQSPPASPTMDENGSFELLAMGPKTPPEPRIVKFALPKAKVRTVVNPLHDTADDQNDDDEDEQNEPDTTATQEPVVSSQTQSNKATGGPNTPDIGPYSPDAYDPFEPTKSPSPPPNDAVQPVESTSNIAMDKPIVENDVVDKESSLPDVIIVSPRSTTATTHKEKTSGDDVQPVPKLSSVHVFSNILLAPAKDARAVPPIQQRSQTLFPLPTTTNIISPSKPSLSQAAKPSPLKFGSSLLSRLPLPPMTKLSKSKSGRHNGNDDGIEGESPYSPQSSDYDDLFEPPPLSPGPSGKKSSSKNRPATTSAGGGVFDELFGTSSPPRARLSKTSLKTTKSVKHQKKSSIKGKSFRYKRKACLFMLFFFNSQQNGWLARSHLRLHSENHIMIQVVFWTISQLQLWNYKLKIK